MKKLITGILATLTCLCCFTGCGLLGKNSSSSVETVATIDAAAAYLDSMYKDHDTKYTDKDYEVVSSVTMEGVTYTVEWAVDVEENVVKVVVGEDGKVTVDVNNLLEEDAAYKLTATLTSPDGTDTKTVEFNRTVKANPIVPVAITKKPEEETAYKLYMYQATKKADEYFNGEIWKNFYLNTSTNQKYAKDVYVDYVEGSETDFNLYFLDEDEVKQYIGIYNSYNSSNGYHLTTTFNSTTNNFDHITTSSNKDLWDPAKNEFFTGSYVFTWSEKDETIVTTLTNAKYEADKNKAPADVTAKTVTAFMGTSGTYFSFGGMSVEEIKNDDTYVGKLVEMLDKRTLSADKKIANEVRILPSLFDKSISEAKTYTLPTTGSIHADVTIAWAVTAGNDIASITDGVLTIATPQANTSITLTATLTIGDELSQVVPLNIEVLKYYTQAEIVDMAYALDKDAKLPEFTLTGTVVGIKSAYSSQFKNAELVMVVDGKEDKPILCYRVKGDGLDSIEIGDEITVTGILTNYKGTIEFEAACTLDEYDLDATVSTAAKVAIEKYAFKLEQTTFTNSVELTLPTTGSVYTDIVITWTTESEDASIVDGVLTVEPVAQGTSVEVVVTATLTLGDVSLTKDLEIVVASYTQAQIVDMAYALEDDNSLPSYSLTGTIISIDYKYNATYKNLSATIVVDGKEDKPIYCYKLVGDATADTDPASLLAVGDKITATGELKNYKGTIEFNGCQLGEYDLEATVSDAAKVATEKAALTEIKTNYTEDATDVALPTTVVYYNDVTIAWTVTGNDNVSYDDNGLDVTLTETAGVATLTATITCGEATVSKSYTLTLAAKVEGQFTKSYTFSNYTAGTQYAENEAHKLDEYVTVTTTKCHFTTEIRIYSSETNNGFAIISSTHKISQIKVNAGNKVDTLVVYGSTDGSTWATAGEISVTSTSYNDYTLSIDLTKSYKYLKLDVSGSNQVRIKSMELTLNE